MTGGKMVSGGLAGVVVSWASGLRFPWVVLLTGTLFVFNLDIPDLPPLADEIIMGLVAVMLASFRKKPAAPAGEDERDA